jgi:hypothetical protein
MTWWFIIYHNTYLPSKTETPLVIYLRETKHTAQAGNQLNIC